jgi:4-aminobutyrate aminotransferase-like enzyme
LRDTPLKEIRGSGLMIGIDATPLPGGAGALQRALLERGYITTTGGGCRDVLVLTPPLIINHDLWMAFEDALRLVVRSITGK